MQRVTGSNPVGSTDTHIMKEEIEKCRKSPFHFATKYVVVKDKFGVSRPFTTRLTEIEFDDYFYNRKYGLGPL